MKIIGLLFLSSVVLGCPAGTHPDGGACAYETASDLPSVKPLDEKPPTDKMPSYQREGIHAEMPQSLIAQDQKQDQDKMNADFVGKKSAGIN